MWIGAVVVEEGNLEVVEKVLDDGLGVVICCLILARRNAIVKTVQTRFEYALGLYC